MSVPQRYPIRVVLADDHEIFRDGFRIMLKKQDGFELVGEAEDGLELLDLVEREVPDVVITDIQMPKMDGVQATRRLVEKYPDTGIIALTMFDDESLIVDMLEAGAKGYLVKNSSKQEIAEAIRTVKGRGVYYCHRTTVKLAKLIAGSKFDPYKRKPRVEFSTKETEIIRYICEEKMNKEIADIMHLSIRTIEGYREKIQEKMDVRNTAGIVIYAVKNGLYRIP